MILWLEFQHEYLLSFHELHHSHALGLACTAANVLTMCSEADHNRLWQEAGVHSKYLTIVHEGNSLRLACTQ
jgi:hypothetical protein